MGKPTKAMRRHFVDQDICPACGKDDDIDYSSPDMSDGQIYMDGVCRSCNTEWTDTFKLSGTEITRSGEDGDE